MTGTGTGTGIEKDTKTAEEEEAAEGTAKKRGPRVDHAVPVGGTEIETGKETEMAIGEVRFCFYLIVF